MKHKGCSPTHAVAVVEAEVTDNTDEEREALGRKAS